mgnify:CR=1 FL=1
MIPVYLTKSPCVYEANILRGIICDAEGDKDSVFEILRRGVVGILDWDETKYSAFSNTEQNATPIHYNRL